VDVPESSPGGGGEGPPDPPAGGSPAEPRPDGQIMARLPRTRPGRQAARRTEPPRPRAGRPAASRPRVEAGAPPSSDPGVFGAGEPAPGLPRLALDGAIEAAKMPVKVSATVTSRAFGALRKGLRRQ
jgi:hypothetical protein